MLDALEQEKRLRKDSEKQFYEKIEQIDSAFQSFSGQMNNLCATVNQTQRETRNQAHEMSRAQEKTERDIENLLSKLSNNNNRENNSDNSSDNNNNNNNNSINNNNIEYRVKRMTEGVMLFMCLHVV